MRSLAWLILVLAFASVGCGSPPPIERPPPPGSPVLARVVLAEHEGELTLRRLRIAIPGSLLSPKKRVTDGISLRLDRDTVRRLPLADVRRIEVVKRVLNRLRVKVLAREPFEGTVEADLQLEGRGQEGFQVSGRLEDVKLLTVRR